jgi:hypothetical protein
MKNSQLDRAQKCRLLKSVLGQMNPFHTFVRYVFKISHNIILTTYMNCKYIKIPNKNAEIMQCKCNSHHFPV